MPLSYCKVEGAKVEGAGVPEYPYFHYFQFNWKQELSYPYGRKRKIVHVLADSVAQKLNETKLRLLIGRKMEMFCIIFMGIGNHSP